VYESAADVSDETGKEQRDEIATEVGRAVVSQPAA
jgi:hypothetical protein